MIKKMGILLLVIVLGFVVVGTYLSERNDTAKCEQAGGLYYSGGWGASNCVFPPKANQ